MRNKQVLRPLFRDDELGFAFDAWHQDRHFRLRRRDRSVIPGEDYYLEEIPVDVEATKVAQAWTDLADRFNAASTSLRSRLGRLKNASVVTEAADVFAGLCQEFQVPQGLRPAEAADYIRRNFTMVGS